jgi:hypothetical protein
MSHSTLHLLRKGPWALALIALSGLLACGEPEPLSPQELMDPAICQSCHPQHYREWAGSMHAYAAEDPVFLAMNARGQRETRGALGTFCVQCHAPMAVRTGATQDGLNLASLPASLRGVTCYFCHQVTEVAGTHNNPLTIAGDSTLRGAIEKPLPARTHRSAASPLHDRRQADSSALCGSCHDVVTPAPHRVELERTYKEWQGSVFATGDGRQKLSCGQCHMPGRSGLAAYVENAPMRTVHDHMMPGVDLALSPFPDIAAQRAAVQRDLDTTVAAKLCVTPEGAGLKVDVTLDNAGAGHSFPSGAAHDRRAWVELSAYNAGALVYQSGGVQEGQAVVELSDPSLWLLRDRVFDPAGQKTHMFWNIARYESDLLPAAVTGNPADPRYFHAVTRSYRLPGRDVDRIRLRLQIRPIDHDVLKDLVQSGDLDDSVRGLVPTFSLAGAQLEWRKDGPSCLP